MSPQQKADVVVSMLLEMIQSKEESALLADKMLGRIASLSAWQKMAVLAFFKNLGARLLGGRL